MATIMNGIHMMLVVLMVVLVIAAAEVHTDKVQTVAAVYKQLEAAVAGPVVQPLRKVEHLQVELDMLVVYLMVVCNQAYNQVMVLPK